MASLNLSLRARRVSAHYFHESVASGNMSADFSGQCLLPQGQQRMLKDLIIHQFFKRLSALTAWRTWRLFASFVSHSLSGNEQWKLTIDIPLPVIGVNSSDEPPQFSRKRPRINPFEQIRTQLSSSVHTTGLGIEIRSTQTNHTSGLNAAGLSSTVINKMCMDCKVTIFFFV